MSIPLTAQIRKPTDGKEFEEQCRRLFALHYNHPNMVRNGKKNQGGCDIVGLKNGDPDHPVGIQCKAKQKLSEKEIRKDFYDAKKYRPRLKEWVVATTATSSSQWKNLALTLTQGSSANPEERIEVSIYDWDDMERLIVSNPASLEYFDPFFSPFLNQFRNDFVSGLERIHAQSERKLSIEKPLPFAKDEVLFYQLFPENCIPEKIPVVFESEAFFFAHIVPERPVPEVQLSSIEYGIGDEYYDLPPSQESWPARNVGDYSLFAHSRFSMLADKRVMTDGVGFFRHGEVFVFDRIDKTIEVMRLATSLKKAVELQAALWPGRRYVSAGARIKPGTQIRFLMEGLEIGRITPAQPLSTRRYLIDDVDVPLRLFIDLLEAGGANDEHARDALASMFNMLRIWNEAPPAPAESPFKDLDF